MLLALALAGCGDLSVKRAKLPSDLSVLVETWQGEPLSILLSLKRNSRDQLDIRVAEGAQIADGRRVWRFEESPAGVRFEDRVDRVSVLTTVGTRLLAVRQREAWVDGGGVVYRCDIRDGRCAPGELPSLHLDHPGPGNGFRVELVHGTLRLFLPQDVSADGVALASGVARIIGVYWVRNATREAYTTVNRTFRGQARIHAPARPIVEDGQLDDWASAAALVVEEAWQLQSGADSWEGERDASFSVAAAWTAERVCLAGRTRDDASVEGDRIQVRIANHVSELALHVPSSRVAPGWWGASWELCVPTDVLPTRGAHPFSVTFVDVDPGQGGTVLATAPELDGAPAGELVLDAPPGP